MNKRIADLLMLLLLLLFTALFAWRFVNFNIPPSEDAAILMRYADHMANGNGIVWNIGEPPVDGATDFLFMIVVAFVHYVGFSLEFTVRLLTILSHFIAVSLIYFGMRKLQNSGIIPAFLSAAYFAVGPGLFLSAAYFGTPFFTLAIAVSWLLAQRLISPDGRTIFNYLYFSIACFIVGLIRPEGVMVSIFMLGAVSMLIPFRDFRPLLILFGIIFLVFGGWYIIWRWNYFGYPLPNPFYKKGGGHLYLSALLDSIGNSFNLLYPFILPLLLSFRNKRTMRIGIAFLIPVVGSVGMWVLLSNEMNFGARFQYPTLALCVLSWYPLVKTLKNDLNLPEFKSLTRIKKIVLAFSSATALIIVFWLQVSNSVDITYAKDGRYDVAVMLSKYTDRNYTIATTEAGLLPLYSGWRAIDTWGLNDKWIAHHQGLVTEEYLRLQKPDIIVWHGYFSPTHPLAPELMNSPWSLQILAMQNYAEHNKFTLAAVFGVSPSETHYYYVRSDLQENNEIVRQIRYSHYAWYAHGWKCKNFINF